MRTVKTIAIALAAAASVTVAIAPASAHPHHPMCHMVRQHHHMVRVCR